MRGMKRGEDHRRRNRIPGQKKPETLGDHIDAVRGKRIARFLSSDLSILKESSSDEVERVLSDLNGDVAGLVTDGGINQRILDLSAGKGLEYVAARDFKGIIKRPLTIRLIKIS